MGSQRLLQNRLNGEVEQESEFAFTVTEGKTISVSNQIAFKYSVKVGIF